MFEVYFAEISLTKDSIKLNNNSYICYKISYSDTTLDVILVNSGVETPTGGRLITLKDLIDDEYFFCAYGDALSNVDFTQQLEVFNFSKADNLVSASRQRSRFGELTYDESSKILTSFEEKPILRNMINIGFFIFNRRVFNLCKENLMLENIVLKELAKDSDCIVYEHSGFWQPIDTVRELNLANEIYNSGELPWSS